MEPWLCGPQQWENGQRLLASSICHVERTVNALNSALESVGEGQAPTAGDRADQSQPPLGTRLGRKWCCGDRLPSVAMLAEDTAAEFASSKRALAAWLPVFHLRSPLCHGTIILGDVLKMDMVSNFLSLITVQEIGVREAERQEKPQTSEKDENTSKLNF